MIKNISALFSHTANETVAKLMSFQVCVFFIFYCYFIFYFCSFQNLKLT